MGQRSSATLAKTMSPPCSTWGTPSLLRPLSPSSSSLLSWRSRATPIARQRPSDSPTSSPLCSSSPLMAALSTLHAASHLPLLAASTEAMMTAFPIPTSFGRIIGSSGSVPSSAPLLPPSGGSSLAIPALRPNHLPRRMKSRANSRRWRDLAYELQAAAFYELQAAALRRVPRAQAAGRRLPPALPFLTHIDIH